jgi:hypothetical protein
MIKAIKELTPQKLIIYLLVTAILSLWYKLEKVEVKGDGKEERKEVKNDKLQHKLDSIQALRIADEKKCSEEKDALKQQQIDDLKALVAKQDASKAQQVKAEKKVDNLSNQTNKLTRLAQDIENQNEPK